MSVIQITEIQREGARLLIMLAGVSGSGKTYTAIQIAYGLAKREAKKVGLLDTENRRGSLYANALPEPILYGELKPPFSPARYVEAIEAFAKAGVEVLVVDSGSHEYEGLGGVQDIAEAGNPRLPNWNKAKGQHKLFMSALLSSPMHIILCLRAREKAKPEKQIVDGKEKTVYVDLGLQPITEKNVVFEATASLMLHEQGRRQDVIKLPADLVPVLGRQKGYLTVEDGEALRAWVDGAKALDPKVEHHKGLLQLAAEKGMAELQKAWAELPKPIQRAIGGGKGCPETYKSSAKAFDEAAAAAAAAAAGGGAPDPSFAALNDAAAKAAAAGNQQQANTPPAGESGSQPAAPVPQAPAPAAAVGGGQAVEDGDHF